MIVVTHRGGLMNNVLMYIDAGSGSMLLAAIASGATGLWFMARSRYYSIKDKLLRRKAPEPDAQSSHTLDS